MSASAARTAVPGAMRASFLLSPEVLEVREVPTPVPGEGEVLVQPASVGLCGSDVHFWEKGRIGDLVVEEPLILGHEVAGRIVAVGPGVDESRIGERVAVDPQRPCRRCRYCHDGRYNLCRLVEFPSAPPVHGAFAEYMRAPSDFAFAVPDSVSDHAAALAEPLSVGIAAVRKANVRPGDRVFVAGAGPIGILTAAAAAAYGASMVVVSDPLSSRREIALAHGATAVVDPRTDALEDESFDAFIDTSGVAVAITAGLRTLSAGGKGVLVGMGTPSVELDLFLLQSRELQIEGLFRYVNTWQVALDLIASGAVEVESLVSGVFGLDDIDESMRRNSEPGTMKFIIDPRR